MSGALRHKLSTQGAHSLTDVEWHLLRVSQFLNALETSSLERFLNEAPLADVDALANGLDAIGASEASAIVHHMSRAMAAGNAPDLEPSRRTSMLELATQLEAAIDFLRTGVEQHLIDYAFRQRELMAERASSRSNPLKRRP